MDPTLLGALIGAGSAAAGAGVAHFSAQQMEGKRLKAAIALEQRDRIAERDREVRVRADTQADHVLKLLISLDHLIKRHRTFFGQSLWPTKEQPRDEAKSLLTQIEASSIYLQQPLRLHVSAVTRFLPDADELSYRGVISAISTVIADDLIANAIEMIGRYLRGEVVDDALPSEIARLEMAVTELDEIHEADMFRQIEEAEAEWEREQRGQGGESSEPDEQQGT